MQLDNGNVKETFVVQIIMSLWTARRTEKIWRSQAKVDRLLEIKESSYVAFTQTQTNRCPSLEPSLQL